MGRGGTGSGIGAHPRVSGENQRNRRPGGSYPGSSPRERGKHISYLQDNNAVGLIPA